MSQILLLSFATATISFTVTETKLFLPLREWTKSKNSFAGELVACGYCFGLWVALALAAIYRPAVFRFWPLLDYVLAALAIAWLSALQWILMCWLMNKAGK